MFFKKIFRRSTVLAMMLGLALTTACDKSTTDEETDTAAADVPTAAGGSTSAAETAAAAKAVDKADSLDDLNISSALSLTLPTALSESSSTSLALAGAKKSHEACEIGRNIEEGIRNLAQVGNMFCHFEAEPDKIPFGVKLNLSITGEGGGAALQGEGEDEDEDGGNFMSIWIDDSTEDTLKVWFCQGDTADTKVLTQLITIDGIGLGSVIDRGSSESRGESWQNHAKFDLGYTEEGRNFLSVGTIFSKGSDAFRRQLVMDLATAATGVSNVKVSNSGSWEGNSHSQEGAARLNAGYGQALFKSSGTHQGEEFTWTHRAHFDSNGLVAAKTASNDFAEPTDDSDDTTAGSLYVFDSDVPKSLPTDFTVAEFPADAWDCVGEQDAEIDMSNSATQAAHNACEGDRGGEGRNCWGDEYQESNEIAEIDPENQKDHDEVDEFNDLSDEEKCREAKRRLDADNAEDLGKLQEFCPGEF